MVVADNACVEPARRILADSKRKITRRTTVDVDEGRSLTYEHDCGGTRTREGVPGFTTPSAGFQYLHGAPVIARTDQKVEVAHGAQPMRVLHLADQSQTFQGHDVDASPGQGSDH